MGSLNPGYKENTMRTMNILAAALLSLVLSSALLSLVLAAPSALAQGTGPIDREYEAAKAAEIASVELQLATRPSATASQELNEAREILRQLREAKKAGQRRQLASRLDMTLARLRISAAGGQ